MVVFCSIVLVGCSNDDKSSEESSTSNTKTSQTPVESSTAESEKTTDSAVSIDIFSTGEYIVGTDIQPGAYYAVLDAIEFADYDSEKNAYITVDVFDDKDEYISDEMFSSLKSKHRFILKEGQKVVFDDNYSPTWTMKLLNEEDFKKYNNNLDSETNQTSESSSSVNEKTIEETPEKTEKSSESSSDFSEQLEELNKLYDDLTDKVKNFSKNPDTYTLTAYLEMQSEMNVSLAKLTDITSETNGGSDLSNKEAFDLYNTVIEKQTELMLALSELPNEFAE